MAPAVRPVSRVAVIDPDFASRERARGTIRQLGDTCLGLVSVDELVALGVRARRFHWVLLACDADEAAAAWRIEQLRAVCGARMPILLALERAPRRGALGAWLQQAERIEVLDAALPPVEQRMRIEAFNQRHGGQPTGGNELCYGAYRFAVARREASRNGEPQTLSRIEFNLALAIFGAGGETMTHDWLLDKVWGHGVDVAPRTLYTHMSALRRALQLDGSAGYSLQTVYGVGYRLQRIAMRATASRLRSSAPQRGA